MCKVPQNWKDIPITSNKEIRDNFNNNSADIVCTMDEIILRYYKK